MSSIVANVMANDVRTSTTEIEVSEYRTGITIGAKKLKEGKVEFYDRATRRAEDLAVDEAVEHTGLRVEQAFKKFH